MRYQLYDLFFYTAGFFLVGVLTASATAAFITLSAQIIFIVLATSSIALALWMRGKSTLIPFTLLMLAGGGYYLSYDAYHINPSIIFNKQTTITGIIIDARHHFDSQELTLETKIKIYADRYPEFNYGDRIAVTGIVQKSRSPLLTGSVNAYHAKIKLLGTRNGNIIKEKLLALRNAFENNLKNVLPHEQAAFLSGLTVGATEEFSKEFKDDLLKSGTTHIVALSGSNITLITWFVGGILGYFLPRRTVFWPTISIITLFVIMTGAEASLVRGAVMGSIMLAANQYERIKSFRNAITAAAFIMILYNPKLLAFDLGFQLSFLTMLGIAYIQPWLEERSGRIRNVPFADGFFATIAAQIAVMPLLIIKTGNIAPWSFIPNMLIVPAIPSTMGAGFITGILGFISPLIAFFPGLLVTVLLQYEMAIIHLFAFGG